jgi:hypothetical protein
MPVRDHITVIRPSGGGEAKASEKLNEQVKKELNQPTNTKLDNDEKRAIAENTVGKEVRDEKAENLRKAEETKVKPQDIHEQKGK